MVAVFSERYCALDRAMDYMKKDVESRSMEDSSINVHL